MSGTITQDSIAIQIDGETVQCQPGETIIQAADRHGVYIPRFCYHDALSVVANCRMCLVEVGKSPKALPACATPVAQDMQVFTKSKKTRDAQKAVMQFLLINHPLDCPICDQGGECDLQDVAMGFGEGVSTFTGKKRAVKDENLGPFIATEMTRCIHCTRCIRFGDEIAGLPELALTQRGGRSAVSTFLEQGVHSELSGNMIDLCPVGALTSKPFRFRGRSWGFTQHAGIAAHDCVGSNTFMHVNQTDADGQAKVMRVVPKTNAAVNEQWLSDIDRFSYQAIQSPQRLFQPMLKKEGAWQVVSWAEALNAASAGLKQVIEKHGASNMAALMSPSASMEAAYVFQKVMRAQGIQHIDHRLRCTDHTYLAHEGLQTGLGMTLDQCQTMDHFLIVGGDVRRQQPLLNHRIRMAQRAGATVSLLHAYDPEYNYPLRQRMLHHPDAWLQTLLGCVRVALGDQKAPSSMAAALKDIEVTEAMQQCVMVLQQAQAPVILLGLEAYHHPMSGRLRTVAEFLATLVNGQVGCVTDGANSAGMWLAGVVPHRGPFAEDVAAKGDAAITNFTKAVKGYWLHQVGPLHDTAHPAQAMRALHDADFVVACSSFDDPNLRAVADVLLPVALPAECSGTYINAEGRWQHAQAAVLPMGEAKPSWKVYRVLGNYTQVEGIQYATLQDVADELAQLKDKVMVPEAQPMANIDTMPKVDTSAITVLPVWASSCQDMMTRHSDSLATLQPTTEARLHPDMIAKLSLDAQRPMVLKHADQRLTVDCVADDTVAENTIVLVIGGDQALQTWPSAYGAVHIEQGA